MMFSFHVSCFAISYITVGDETENKIHQLRILSEVRKRDYDKLLEEYQTFRNDITRELRMQKHCLTLVEGTRKTRLNRFLHFAPA